MSNSKAVLEALLFTADAPLSADRIAETLGWGAEQVKQAVLEQNRKYEESQSAIRIREVAGGYQMYTLPEYSSWIESLFAKIRKQRLSKAALETLSIIAYKQPVTRIEVDRIRGVQSDAPLKTLLDRGLVEMTGRDETIGRPILYGTGQEFLLQFGLKNLSELPRLEEVEFAKPPAEASLSAALQLSLAEEAGPHQIQPGA